MPTDSFTSALAQLDPANRALLDLSLRRGMRPEEISDLLGTDPESVMVAREQALEHLAEELGMDNVSELDDVRARLAELPPESWTGSRAPLPQVEAIMEESEADETPRAKSAPRAKAEPPKKEQKKSRLPLLLTLLAVAAVLLVIVVASSGGSDEGSTAAAPSTPAPPKPAAKAAPSKPTRSAPKPVKPAAAGPKVALAGLGGRDAKGTANLLDGGKRLRLDITGLPAGTYQVWLYNSIIDSHSLTQARGTTLALDLKLPANAGHFKLVDISREPADGNPNHSGQSLLRVPLAKLSR